MFAHGHKLTRQQYNMFCLADMMASFAEMLSAELADDAAEDSFSFYRAWFGKRIENPREAIVHHSVLGRFSLRHGNWKLLLAPGSGGRTAPLGIEATSQGLPEMQLYNMEADIGETNNLIDQYPEKVAALVELLESYVARGRSTPGTDQQNEVDIDIWKRELNSIEPHPNYR